MTERDSDEKTSASTPIVFISYASQDAAVANAITEALERCSLRCWIAPRDVMPGAPYAGQIIHAIDAAKASVLILSKDAASSPHVLREVERSASKRHPIVSLRIDQVSLPADLEYFVMASHWLDASAGDMDRAMPKLVAAVQVAVNASAAVSADAPTPATSPVSAPSTRKLALVLASGVGLGLLGLAVDRLWLSNRRAVAIPVAAPVVSAPVSVPAAPTIPDKSVAVLPFVDMSEKKNQEYFSDGLSEELIDMLVKIPDLRVPARTSSFYFKGKQATIADIAKVLGVAHVLEGSVRKSGNHLRITAQLVRADSGYHLWSETYDRQLDDIFNVQDEIATAVVGALKLKLLDVPTAKDRQTTNPAAHDQYLIGRRLLAGGNYAVDRNAAEAFRRAVNLDPNYASAWAGLAEATLDALDADSTLVAEFNAMRQEAQTAADKAIALRPDLPDGYIARGYIRSIDLKDFRGADQDFRRALSIEPENSEALFRYSNSVLMPTGRLDEAVAMATRAVKSDPLNADAWARLGGNQFYRGDYLAARESWQRSLEINPQQSWVASSVAYTFLLVGEPAKALPIAQRASSEVFRLQGAALAEHDLGNVKEAEQRLSELIAKSADSGAYQIAEVYAWWADKDNAFQWLDRASVQHDGGLILVKVDPLLKSIRPDPRFKAFLRKMNLPE